MAADVEEFIGKSLEEKARLGETMQKLYQQTLQEMLAQRSANISEMTETIQFCELWTLFEQSERPPKPSCISSGENHHNRAASQSGRALQPGHAALCYCSAGQTGKSGRFRHAAAVGTIQQTQGLPQLFDSVTR